MRDDGKSIEVGSLKGDSEVCFFFFFFVFVCTAAIVCCAITSFPVLFVVFGIWKFLFVLSVGAFCSCM